MFNRGILLLGISLVWLCCSCETLVTAYLINELLNDKAPSYRWTGHVQDATGSDVAGVNVVVLAEYEGDSDVITFDDPTDENGDFDVKWRWHSDVTYKIRVMSESTILAEERYGSVEKGDRETNFVIQGSTSTELSGLVDAKDCHDIETIKADLTEANEILAERVKTLEGIVADMGDFRKRVDEEEEKHEAQARALVDGMVGKLASAGLIKG